jgi:hypothetical protein
MIHSTVIVLWWIYAGALSIIFTISISTSMFDDNNDDNANSCTESLFVAMFITVLMTTLNIKAFNEYVKDNEARLMDYNVTLFLMEFFMIVFILVSSLSLNRQNKE